MIRISTVDMDFGWPLGSTGGRCVIMERRMAIVLLHFHNFVIWRCFVTTGITYDTAQYTRNRRSERLEIWLVSWPSGLE
jgi:hypothetical protein